MSNASSAQQVSSEAPRARVLLIEDERPLALAYQRFLRHHGFEVDVCGSCREAEAHLRGEGLYDVVLSDVVLPDMDGLQLLKLLRSRDSDVPVVLMSGMPTLESAFQAIEQGVLRYLSKPFALDTLYEAVTAALKAGQAARQRREAARLHGDDPLVQEGRRNAGIRLERALATMRMHYQPIVDRGGRLRAYEALLRCDEPSLRRPDDLIVLAERLERLQELGRRARALVARDAPQAPADVSLYVNLHPRDLIDDELYSSSAPLTAIARRVVLEITERASLRTIPDLVQRVAALRGLGFRIAVDDLGEGYAGLSNFAWVNPDVVKIDRSLIAAVTTDQNSRHVVHAICELSHQLGVHVVAEGVETPGQAQEMLRLGSDLLQGYLFARPAAPFVAPAWPAELSG